MIKILAACFTFGGIIILGAKEIYRCALRLPEEYLSGPRVTEEPFTSRIRKYRWFSTNIYDKYKFVFLGPLLTIIGFILTLF
ncbi:hypothetical protein ACFL1I_00350 [Candidatus Omnitrophota bacterium]